MKIKKSILILTASLSCLTFSTAGAQTKDAGPAVVDASPAMDAAIVAPDAGVTEPKPPVVLPESAVDQATGAYSAVRNGFWLLAFGFIAMLIGTAGRWLVAKKWAFIETQAGGYFVAISAGLSILGAGIVRTGGLSMNLVYLALVATFTAMGMHGPVSAIAAKAKKAPAA